MSHALLPRMEITDSTAIMQNRLRRNDLALRHLGKLLIGLLKTMQLAI